MPIQFDFGFAPARRAPAPLPAPVVVLAPVVVAPVAPAPVAPAPVMPAPGLAAADAAASRAASRPLRPGRVPPPAPAEVDAAVAAFLASRSVTVCAPGFAAATSACLA